MASLDILLPHYNDPEGLLLSLQSVLEQTWPGEMRVVIADDGSSEPHRSAVCAIVDDLRETQSGKGRLEIDLILCPVNRGRPFSRNVLLDAIESPYVAWLDAGDEWYPQKLAVQFDLMRSIEASEAHHMTWITCNYDWQWLGGDRKKKRQNTDQDQHKALLMGKDLRAYLWTLLGSAASFKSIGYFDERLPRMQDLDYFIRFVSHGGTIRNVDTPDAFCVYHKSDIGRNADEIRACKALIYDKHRVIFNRYGENFCKMRLYNMDMLAARFAQNNNDHKRARYYMWSAFRNKPLSFLQHVRRKGLSA